MISLWYVIRLQIVLLLVAISQTGWAQDYVPGEVIVKLKGKSSSATSGDFFNRMQGKISLKTSFSAMNLHKVSIDQNSKLGASVEAAIAELKNDPSVEYAEPNYILRKHQDSLQSSSVLNEDEVRAQMQAGDTFVQNYANVGVEQAWPMMANLTQQTERPIVAIIDTGVDYNHAIFRNSNAMWRNSGEVAGNGVDDDGNGFIDDLYGWNFHGRNNNPMDDDEHGTHVAGIVLGVGQDIFPTVWETAKIRIMALKFLGADGSGSTSDAVAAIYYAVNNGSQVINNSWGGSSYSQSLHEALTYAYDRKVFIASAAGNSAKNNDVSDMYPANYPVPGQIAIAATNDSDNMASFSNYGVSKVHAAAPGVSILSAVPAEGYRFMSGTSMATPFVSGVAALIMREAPSLTGYQVKNLIINSSSVMSNLSTRVQSSARVDVYDAINSARGQVSTAAYQPSYKAEQRAPAAADAAASITANGCGAVSTTAYLYNNNSQGKGGNGQSPGMSVAILLLIPLLAWQILRSRGPKKVRRQYDRFLMNSAMRLNVNGQELVGHMRTISEGGLSFEANTLIEKGGVLTMSIQSPDGKEMIQVQGHVVWSEDNKSYGVKFDEAKQGALDSIRNWSKKLVRVADY